MPHVETPRAVTSNDGEISAPLIRLLPRGRRGARLATNGRELFIYRVWCQRVPGLEIAAASHHSPATSQSHRVYALSARTHTRASAFVLHVKRGRFLEGAATAPCKAPRCRWQTFERLGLAGICITKGAATDGREGVKGNKRNRQKWPVLIRLGAEGRKKETADEKKKTFFTGRQ